MTDDNLVAAEKRHRHPAPFNDECLPFLIRRRESQKLGHSLTIACSRGERFDNDHCYVLHVKISAKMGLPFFSSSDRQFCLFCATLI